jgi:hypothetical protein
MLATAVRFVLDISVRWPYLHVTFRESHIASIPRNRDPHKVVRLSSYGPPREHQMGGLAQCSSAVPVACATLLCSRYAHHDNAQ